MRVFLKKNLSKRTLEDLRTFRYDLKRFWVRMWQPKKLAVPSVPRIQLGAGARKVEGWLNVDLSGADVNLDLTYPHLPWKDQSVEHLVSQHLVEHLVVEDELLPLLKEVHRILKPGGEVWLATPDLEKVARSYLDHNCEDMIADRLTRMPNWSLKGMPAQHMMNDLFHQHGEHKNLFDFEFLQWLLQQAGFNDIARVNELDLLEKYQGFPPRHDDYQALYVRAIKT